MRYKLPNPVVAELEHTSYDFLMRSLFMVWIRPFRAALGFSQAQAAAQAEVPASQWLRWDKGGNDPLPKSYATIAKGLDYKSVADWMKDFIRFASEHPEFVDQPWDEDHDPPPNFTRRFGSFSKVSELREGPPKSFAMSHSRPLSLAYHQLMEVEIEKISSESKREKLKQRQRRLLNLLTFLEEEMGQFFEAAVVRSSRTKET